MESKTEAGIKGSVKMKLVCSKCRDEVKRITVEGMKEPITDVVYCDIHGVIQLDVEIVEDHKK